MYTRYPCANKMKLENFRSDLPKLFQNTKTRCHFFGTPCVCTKQLLPESAGRQTIRLAVVLGCAKTTGDGELGQKIRNREQSPTGFRIRSPNCACVHHHSRHLAKKHRMINERAQTFKITVCSPSPQASICFETWWGPPVRCPLLVPFVTSTNFFSAVKLPCIHNIRLLVLDEQFVATWFATFPVQLLSRN